MNLIPFGYIALHSLSEAWGWHLWFPATAQDKVGLVQRPALGRAPWFQLGSGGQVSAPCPIAVLTADDFKPRVVVSLPGEPKLDRDDGFRHMQQLDVTTDVEKYAHLPGLRLLGHHEDESTVSGMAAHDGHYGVIALRNALYHPVRGEVALMQRE